jgi:hypothetical protein
LVHVALILFFFRIGLTLSGEKFLGIKLSVMCRWESTLSKFLSEGSSGRTPCREAAREFDRLPLADGILFWPVERKVFEAESMSFSSARNLFYSWFSNLAL